MKWIKKQYKKCLFKKAIDDISLFFDFGRSLKKSMVKYVNKNRKEGFK